MLHPPTPFPCHEEGMRELPDSGKPKPFVKEVVTQTAALVQIGAALLPSPLPTLSQSHRTSVESRNQTTNQCCKHMLRQGNAAFGSSDSCSKLSHSGTSVTATVLVAPSPCAWGRINISWSRQAQISSQTKLMGQHCLVSLMSQDPHLQSNSEGPGLPGTQWSETSPHRGWLFQVTPNCPLWAGRGQSPLLSSMAPAGSAVTGREAIHGWKVVGPMFADIQLTCLAPGFWSMGVIRKVFASFSYWQ